MPTSNNNKEEESKITAQINVTPLVEIWIGWCLRSKLLMVWCHTVHTLRQHQLLLLLYERPRYEGLLSKIMIQSKRRQAVRIQRKIAVIKKIQDPKRIFDTKASQRTREWEPLVDFKVDVQSSYNQDGSLTSQVRT